MKDRLTQEEVADNDDTCSDMAGGCSKADQKESAGRTLYHIQIGNDVQDGHEDRRDRYEPVVPVHFEIRHQYDCCGIKRQAETIADQIIGCRLHQMCKGTACTEEYCYLIREQNTHKGDQAGCSHRQND